LKRSIPTCVLGLMLATTGLGLTVAPSQAIPDIGEGPPPNLVCDGTYTGQTFKNVRVRPGDTCVLKDSTVTGNLMARRPGTVKVIDTEVRRNLKVRGATDYVKIGNAGCKLDPVVGNNIQIRDSHNVLICYMTTKNNISVTGSDGRISLFHNNAGRHIAVSRNEAYDPDPGVKHENPGAIRLRHNTAGGHIRLADNHPSRDLLGLGKNAPSPEVN
jgi:hypothetical protein